MRVGRPCLPFCNDIVTPRHLFSYETIIVKMESKAESMLWGNKALLNAIDDLLPFSDLLSECGICMMPIESPDSMAENGCGHVFCVSCWREYLTGAGISKRVS